MRYLKEEVPGWGSFKEILWYEKGGKWLLLAALRWDTGLWSRVSSRKYLDIIIERRSKWTSKPITEQEVFLLLFGAEEDGYLELTYVYQNRRYPGLVEIESLLRNRAI